MNVIITGASTGIGFSIAESFAALGYSLLLCSKSATRLYKAVEDLYNRYPDIRIKSFLADLSTKEGCEELTSFVKETGWNIDILVNNAGTYVPGSVHNEPEEQLSLMLNTNLFSAYYITRGIVPSMIEAGSGHIFNICSIASQQAYSNGGSYSISKFALLGFGKNLREELKPHGIKVTNVLPGATYSRSWEDADIDKKRIMEAGDIAKMIVAASQLSLQACVEEIVLRPQLGDL